MSYFARLKEKYKNEARERTAYNMLLLSLCSMFKWNIFPDNETHNENFNRFFERYLHQTGSFAVIPGKPADGSGWFVIPEPSLAGNLDQFGWGMQVSGTTRNGEFTIDNVSRDDAIVCFNNSNRIPDFEMIEYAYALSQIDKAILVNTKLSGFAPVFDAPDTKSAAAINEILTNLYNGEIKAITSQPKNQILDEKERNVLSIDTITPQRVQYVQYLSQLYDNMIRRFYNTFGVDITNVNKQAQVNEDELNGWSGFSEIMKQNMLRERQNFCNRVNARYGTSWSVDLQTPYKQETEQFLASPDESTDDSKDETTDETKEGENDA